MAGALARALAGRAQKLNTGMCGINFLQIILLKYKIYFVNFFSQKFKCTIFEQISTVTMKMKMTWMMTTTGMTRSSK